MKLNLPLHTAAVLLAMAVAAQGQTASTSAPSEDSTPRRSIAVEADAVAYALPGFSAIATLSLRNHLQIAAGAGSYEVPSFLLKGEDHYDQAKWKAKVTDVQLLRIGYRFKGPMKNGPVLGVVMLNQNWKLSSERFTGEARFRQFSAGLTGGYYIHVGRHFYLYPTAALTANKVYSGDPMLGGISYKAPKIGPVATVHVGWEWGW